MPNSVTIWSLVRCVNARTPTIVESVRSCSTATSRCRVRSGTKVVPLIGANVRSGGSHVPATIEGTNSSAPGASARRDAPTLTRTVSTGATVRRARGLSSDFSM